MLQLKINSNVFYDDFACTFIEVDERLIKLEHSLVSVAKWESKWYKPFLDTKEKTTEETLDYIRCMIVEGELPDKIPLQYILTAEQFKQINDYISNPMTATTISNRNSKPGREIITAEIIYYWMTALGIDFSCQYWHLNRLLMLIQVCSIKNAPSKKMKKNDIYKQNAALNRARRAKSGSKG